MTAAVRSSRGAIAELVATTVGAHPEIDPAKRRLSVPMHTGTGALVRLARALEEVGLDVADVSLRRPDLDEVFLHLTEGATR